jgi:hypothetical protein
MHRLSNLHSWSIILLKWINIFEKWILEMKFNFSKYFLLEASKFDINSFVIAFDETVKAVSSV